MMEEEKTKGDALPKEARDIIEWLEKLRDTVCGSETFKLRFRESIRARPNGMSLDLAGIIAECVLTEWCMPTVYGDTLYEMIQQRKEEKKNEDQEI